MKRYLLSILVLICLTPVLAQIKIPTVLQGATVIDSWNNSPRHDYFIVIQGNTIDAAGKKFELNIPENAQFIDLTGKFVMPGLIDVHASFRDSLDLVAMFFSGVTTINIITTDIDQSLIRSSMIDSVPIPQIMATVPIPLHEQLWEKKYNNAIDSIVNNIPQTVEQAQAEIRQLAAKGVTRICLFYDPMQWCSEQQNAKKYDFDSTVVDALINEAKKFKLAISVQAPEHAKALQAVNLGITSVEHGVMDQRLTSDFVERVGYLMTNYVPNLTRAEAFANPEGVLAKVASDSLFKKMIPAPSFQQYSKPDFLKDFSSVCGNPQYTKEHLTAMYDNCESIIKNYIPVPMGTDLPMFPGVAAHLEIENFLKAGITPMQALVSATAISAECLGIRKIAGFIFVKCRADMIVLDKNPVDDVKNTRTISMIIKRGHVFDLRPPAPTPKPKKKK